jgi:hypothetical protein
MQQTKWRTQNNAVKKKITTMQNIVANFYFRISY